MGSEMCIRDRDVLVELMQDQLMHLTERQREEVRRVLLNHNHPLAGNFLAGWSNNVVAMPQQRDGGGRAVQLAKKKERAAKEAARRLELKGASGGGQPQRKKKK